MPRLLTWVLRLLPVLGIVLALVGVGVFGGLPDSWWDPKGFIVNLASGFTAACFGIPVAFFVLQRLLVLEDSKRTRDKARRGLADRLGTVARATALRYNEDDFARLKRLEDALWTGVTALGDLIDYAERKTFRVLDRKRYDDYRARVKRLRTELETNRLSTQTMHRSLEVAQMQWRIAYEHALPLAEQEGVQFIPPVFLRSMGVYMKADHDFDRLLGGQQEVAAADFCLHQVDSALANLDQTLGRPVKNLVLVDAEGAENSSSDDEGYCPLPIDVKALRRAMLVINGSVGVLQDRSRFLEQILEATEVAAGNAFYGFGGRLVYLDHRND